MNKLLLADSLKLLSPFKEWLNRLLINIRNVKVLGLWGDSYWTVYEVVEWSGLELVLIIVIIKRLNSSVGGRVLI